MYQSHPTPSALVIVDQDAHRCAILLRARRPAEGDEAARAEQPADE